MPLPPLAFEYVQKTMEKDVFKAVRTLGPIVEMKTDVCLRNFQSYSYDSAVPR